MNEEFQNQEPTHEEKKEEEEQFATLSPLATAFIALVGIFLLYQVGGAILTLAIFGFNFEKANVNAIRMLTMGGQIMFILLPALILAKKVYHHNTTFILRMKIPHLKEVGVFVIGLLLLTPLLQSFLSLQNTILSKLSDVSPLIKRFTDFMNQLDKLVTTTYGNLLKSHSPFETSFIIFVVAVIPAICEETLFRGLVQKSFEQKLKPFLSIFITAIFFGIYHFNPYGVIPLISLGIYFGYAAYLSDSIFVPMTLHFFNNLISVLAFIMLGDAELIKSAGIQSSRFVPQLITFATLSLLFFSYMVFVKKNYRNLISKRKETV